MLRFFKTPVLTASILPVALALSACSGGSGSAVPTVSNQNAFSQSFANQVELTPTGTQPNTGTCPSRFTAGCYTFSLSKGLKVAFCYGPSSDRCSTTKDYTWSGNVCLTKAKRCKPIAQLKAKWTGPFKCTKKTCKSRGEYELDTITKGSPAPKKTQQYVYKQQIHICGGGGCVNYWLGINVGS